MDALPGMTEKQRYYLHLGRLADSLLRLETAMRKYLCAVDGVSPAEGRTLSELRVKMKLAKEPYTDDFTFGELVKLYNKAFSTEAGQKKYQVSDAIISTRNTLAHGRIYLPQGGEVPSLANFSVKKKKDKFVYVDSVITNCVVWCDYKVGEVEKQISRVDRAFVALTKKSQAKSG